MTRLGYQIPNFTYPDLAPTGIFDNRVDHTSFLRADPTAWDPQDVADLHAALDRAFEGLRDR